MTQQSRILEMSANIVSSLVRSRPTEPHEVPALMDVVHDGLKRLEAGERAVSVKAAIAEVEGAARVDHVVPSRIEKAASTSDDAPQADLDRETGYVREGIRTVTDGHIVCLDDGRHVTFLGRHLKSIGVDPSEYLKRRGLPADYPMTAPAYVAEKRRLANKQGLGRRVKPARSPATNGAKPPRITGRLSASF